MEKYREDIIRDWEAITGLKPKLMPMPGYPGKSLAKNDEGPVRKEFYQKLLGKLIWFSKRSFQKQ